MSHAILAVGEVLWDLLPTGKQLGGAPANFAYHCRSLGALAKVVLKLNDQELPELAAMFGLPAGERESMAELARRFGLSLVALTRGSGGSRLLAEDRWSDHPGRLVEVCDTIGAGDAFTAALAVGLLAGRPLEKINRHANEVAAFVCSRPGGMPALPDALKLPANSPPEACP
jgi:fructokinase